VTFLLDVNLLMALLWENHEHHIRARKWLGTVPKFATCPIGQLGFIRVSSHPLLGFGMVPEDAARILRRFISDPRHHFVPDDVRCDDRALLTERMTSPNQVTDYYLATLARQHKLSLATFDKQMSMAFPDEPGLVRLVS
jgi:toxin-antitoxin system PIN domain toxin